MLHTHSSSELELIFRTLLMGKNENILYKYPENFIFITSSFSFPFPNFLPQLPRHERNTAVLPMPSAILTRHLNKCLQILKQQYYQKFKIY
jgi:hypothetical protein